MPILERNDKATNEDLIDMVVRATRKAWPTVPLGANNPIARKTVARDVHAMAQRYVRYKQEDGTQKIRLPHRTLIDGYGDCKSTSVLIASVCRAAGCNVVLRFARYAGDDHFGHVFAVVDGVPVDHQLPFGEQVFAEQFHNVTV